MNRSGINQTLASDWLGHTAFEILFEYYYLLKNI